MPDLSYQLEILFAAFHKTKRNFSELHRRELNQVLKEIDNGMHAVLTLQSLACNLSWRFRVARWAPAWWCWCGVLHFCCCGSQLPAYSWTSPHTPGTSCLSSSSHCAASMPPRSAIYSAAPAPHDQHPGRFFEHNRSKYQCFQVQSVTCCDLSVFLHWFEVHSIDSSKMISKFHEVLNFNHLFLKLNWFICN